MTERDLEEQRILENAVTSLNRSAIFWESRDPLYAKQLLVLSRNFPLLLEEAEKKFALIIGEQLIPINFADLDEAFDFAQSNAGEQAAIIHEIKPEGIVSNQVYERAAPWERIRNKGKQRVNVYKTIALEQGIVEWGEEMEKLSPHEKQERLFKDFPGSKEAIDKKRQRFL